MKATAAVAWKAGEPLIIETVDLERINEGFDLMKRGESIRSVVEF